MHMKSLGPTKHPGALWKPIWLLSIFLFLSTDSPGQLGKMETSEQRRKRFKALRQAKLEQTTPLNVAATAAEEQISQKTSGENTEVVR